MTALPDLENPPSPAEPLASAGGPGGPRPDDVVDAVLGAAAARVAALRDARPEVIVHTQGAYRALLHPDPDPGHDPDHRARPAGAGTLLRADRVAVALRVAAVSAPDAASDPLVAHYRADLDPVLAERVLDGRVADQRLAALLRHADLLTVRPSAATPARHAELLAHGLTVTDIVTLSQLVAFVSYQLRVIAGLAVIAAAASPDPIRPDRHLEDTDV